MKLHREGAHFIEVDDLINIESKTLKTNNKKKNIIFGWGGSYTPMHDLKSFGRPCNNYCYISILFELLLLKHKIIFFDIKRLCFYIYAKFLNSNHIVRMKAQIVMTFYVNHFLANNRFFPDQEKRRN